MIPSPPLSLPIDDRLGEIVDAVVRDRRLVVSAEPGAGKTTRIPRALLASGRIEGTIVVLEPRRLAARLAAERVAEELGEAVGKTVGYVTRFDRATSRDTRLLFLTEGVLTRRLTTDPTLKDVGAVVLDEFHERHLASDLALACVVALRRSARPELAVLVMSATLDAEPIAAYLDARSLHVEGRKYPIEIEHATRADDRPLALQVTSAVRSILDRGQPGHVLVFLPNVREIRHAERALSSLARDAGFDVRPLHGSLPRADQDRAVRPSERRKVVLATNVAESSITIDGVGAVVDSGLAQIASVDLGGSFPVLRLTKIARSSCVQRAGRAGRTGPGVVLRLFTAGDFSTRPAQEAPEIQRSDLTEAALEVALWGRAGLAELPFFEPPRPAQVASADRLLGKLGARDDGGALTELGRRMASFPLPPRVSRVVCALEARGLGREAGFVAAVLSERLGQSFADALEREPNQRSDVLAASTLLADLASLSQGEVRARGFDPTATQRLVQVARAVDRAVRAGGEPPGDPRAYEDAMLSAIAAGYVDRVARLREREGDVVLAIGGSAARARSSVVRHGELVVVVDLEERRVDGRPRNTASLLSAITADDVFDACFDELVERTTTEWLESVGEAERVTSLMLGQLVIEEKRVRLSGEEAKRGYLLETARRRGLAGFPSAREALAEVNARAAVVRGAGIGGAPEPIDEARFEDALPFALASVASIKELEGHDFGEAWLSLLGPAERAALDRHAPRKIALPSGRSVPVTYPTGEPPYVASRLQDFFGTERTPAIAEGRVPLLVHLLAPNQRAVQVTRDLTSFWQNHYKDVSKELRRRYPRHHWPEDPKTADPTVKPRRR